MRLGNTDISSVKLGSSQVQAVYLGNNLVWQNAPVAIAATGVGTTSFTANWEAYSGATYYLLDVSESSDFSTFVYENQVTTSTSYVVIGLESNTTYYYRVRAAVEADVQAFFQRVSDAGGTLTVTEQIAIINLVADLKSDGIWTKMKAIYPMVGASAASCAQNLKSSSFTGTFTSGWTFASTGVTGNGTSAYMDTTFNPNTSSNVNSKHLSYYSRNNFNYCQIGISAGVFDQIYYLGTAYYNILSSSSFTTITTATTNGFIITSRTSALGGCTTFVNNSNLGNDGITATGNPNGNLWLNARNAFSGYSNNECAFASIGDGLTDTEASNFYTAVQGFNTTLDRYVGAPWYDNGELLLDAYPDSAAAYSLRKLRNNYIGGPIRVRRSSDNEEQDIYFDANGELDITQLTTFCGAGDGFVKTWYDQSGNGYNATQSTAANQPQIVSSGSVIINLNNLPTLKFDGVNDNLKSASFTGINQPFTLFLINKWNGLTGFPYLIDLGLDRALGFVNAASTNGMYFGGGLNSNVSPNINNSQLWYALPNGTNSQISINNETVITGNAGTRDASIITIASYGANNYYANSFISEFIFYTSNESTNRTGIETNINDFYSIY